MAPAKFKFWVKFSSVVSAVVLFVLLVVAIWQFARIGVLARKEAKLKKELDYISVAQDQTKDAIARHKDVAYVEEYAREHLGYIKDGDIIYQIEQ